MKKRIALCCAVVWVLVACFLAACAAAEGEWECPACGESVPYSVVDVCPYCGWNHLPGGLDEQVDYPVYDYSDGPVVVSLGDSYSAGEGIPPFYGQYDDDGKPVPLEEKARDFDWLAHRSTLSWPGKLIFPGMAGTLKDYRDRNWYFMAASGATTGHIINPQIKKVSRAVRRQNPVKSHFPRYNRYGSSYRNFELEMALPAQIRIFRELRREGKLADYVTLTIGGNDAKFSEIITEAVINSTHLTEIALTNPVWEIRQALMVVQQVFGSKLNKSIRDVWALYSKESGIRDSLEHTYRLIAREAGPQATILVAGYPHLLEPNGKGLPISLEEARAINSAVDDFNAEIEALVNECREKGMNIRFVDVQQSYFRDHGAYANLPWLNDLEVNINTEDLAGGAASAYSFHPNEEGAKAYARAVTHEIFVCESEKYLRALRTPEEDSYVSYYDFGLFTGIIQMPEALAGDEYDVPPTRADCTIILYNAQGKEAYVYEQNGRAGFCLCVKSGAYRYEILSPSGEALFNGECEIGRGQQFWQAFRMPDEAASPFAEDGWYQVLISDVTPDGRSGGWMASGDVYLPRPLLLTTEQARAITPDSSLGDVYIWDVQGSVDDGDLTMNDGTIWLEPNGDQWEVLGEGDVSLMYDLRYASFRVRPDADLHWTKWDDEEMDIVDVPCESPLDLLDDDEMDTPVSVLIEDGEAVELYRTDDEAW